MPNQLSVIGSIGHVAEKTSQKGTKVLEVSIYSKPNYNKGNAQSVMLKGVMYGNYANAMAKVLSKGMQVTVFGELTMNKVEKDGKVYNNYGMNISRIVPHSEFKPSNKKESATQEETFNEQDPFEDVPSFNNSIDISDEDLPF